MDISINKPIKSFLRPKFSEWYSEKLSEQSVYEDDNEPVDISTARVMCIRAQWLIEVMEYLEGNPHINVNGFKHASVHQALVMLNDDYEELPM